MRRPSCHLAMSELLDDLLGHELTELVGPLHELAFDIAEVRAADGAVVNGDQQLLGLRIHQLDVKGHIFLACPEAHQPLGRAGARVAVRDPAQHLHVSLVPGNLGLAVQGAGEGAPQSRREGIREGRGLGVKGTVVNTDYGRVDLRLGAQKMPDPSRNTEGADRA